MGYSTGFEGELKVSIDLSGPERAYLNAIMGSDIRDNPEWYDDIPDTFICYHLDVEYDEDRNVIRWNGAEKTYGMEGIIGLVIALMQKIRPDFSLTGQFLAQGEEMGDVYKINVNDNIVERKDLKVDGLIECPNCGHGFVQ